MKKEFFHLTVCLLFTLCALYSVFWFRSASNITMLIEIPSTILEGAPHWRAFQNRLLTPWFWSILNNFGLSELSAFIIVSGAMLFCNFYLMTKIYSSSSNFILFLLLLSWLIVFSLLHHDWLYLWDFFDIVLFTVITGIFLGKIRESYLLLIFPIALLNRESALFIPIAYFLFKGNFQNNFPFFKAKFIYLFKAGFTLILGALFIKILRDNLFIQQKFGMETLLHQTIGNHFYLPGNVKNLFYYNFLDHNMMLSVSILLIIMLSIYIFFTSNKHEDKCLIAFALTYFVNILIFGNMVETRMYYALIFVMIVVFVRNLTIMKGSFR